MNRVRHRPLPPQHVLAPIFDQAVDSLCAALHPDTTRHYRGTARNFLRYLSAKHPKLGSLDQLRRDTHILGWMSHLRSQAPPLATASYINVLIALRCIFHELAWTQRLPELADLIRREDIPRVPRRLPRPLDTQQDQLLQNEFLRRNDLGGNAFLLIRHTGMRIGECADLSVDCIRSTGPQQWAIHVPLGKLKTERMVPVDSFVCELVTRLRFFRSLDPVPPDGRLIGRPNTKEALVRQLRDYLHQVCHSLGLSTRIVPHQFRHTYATEMLRSGVSFPVLMRLLGHTNPEMTMRYVEIALTDLQREFHLARSKPRHLVPQPKIQPAMIRAGRGGVIDSFLAAQHALQVFSRSLPKGSSRSCLDRLANRLTKILAIVRKLSIP